MKRQEQKRINDLIYKAYLQEEAERECGKSTYYIVKGNYVFFDTDSFHVMCFADVGCESYPLCFIHKVTDVSYDISTYFFGTTSSSVKSSITCFRKEFGRSYFGTIEHLIYKVIKRGC